MPKSVTSAPSFCPNADILFELRASQSAHNRGFASIEPDRASKSHAHIADLERFEDELDELLLRKSDDDPMFAELKRRRMQLRAEIERLRSKVAKRRPN
jgi:hypothetical protein